MMEKVSYSEEKRLLVERALEEYFPAEDIHSSIVYQAMRHSLFSKSKRFRPVLLLLVAEAFQEPAEEALSVACAVEYIHTYSLIHDDLPAIDNSDLRRGKSTCHVLFGEDIAILAGDALFAEAFYLVSHETQAEPDVLVKVFQELSLAASVRGMVGGQVVDISSVNKRISQETLHFIHTNKTGKLIVASARCGAILAKASPDDLKAISNYAYFLGLAFQITDDILDVVGEEELLGKKTGSDDRVAKATFPALFGLGGAKKEAKEATEKAISWLDELSTDTTQLADLAYFVYHREQ